MFVLLQLQLLSLQIKLPQLLQQLSTAEETKRESTTAAGIEVNKAATTALGLNLNKQGGQNNDGDNDIYGLDDEGEEGRGASPLRSASSLSWSSGCYPQQTSTPTPTP